MPRDFHVTYRVFHDQIILLTLGILTIAKGELFTELPLVGRGVFPVRNNKFFTSDFFSRLSFKVDLHFAWLESITHVLGLYEVKIGNEVCYLA